jgi:hypothetical protein
VFAALAAAAFRVAGIVGVATLAVIASHGSRCLAGSLPLCAAGGEPVGLTSLARRGNIVD